MDKPFGDFNGVGGCIFSLGDAHCQSCTLPGDVWKHCLENHSRLLPTRSHDLLRFREIYEISCWSPRLLFNDKSEISFESHFDVASVRKAHLRYMANMERQLQQSRAARHKAVVERILQLAAGVEPDSEEDLRRRGSPYASSLNAKPRENKRKVLRVQIKDKYHLACPDSGSQKNIISKACALEHGFRIRHRKAKDIKRFEVGNGDIAWSIGRVFETVGLPGNPLWKEKRWFYVLEHCPVPVVMGMEFLRKAEILTKYKGLLEDCPVETSNISSLLWIGSPRNRLRCTIDGRRLEAVPDTGSDYNLMSLPCAQREGFRVDRRTEARTQIVVGNGEAIETLGQVYVSNITLDWREPEAEPSERSPHTLTADVPLEPGLHGSAHPPIEEGEDDSYTPFHVVENLPCDIILGQKFLLDTDAFNKCPGLLNIPRSDQSRQFDKHKQQFEFMIFRSKILPHISFFKKPKLPIDLKEQHESDGHAERYRRLKNKEKIELLPPSEQDAAQNTERKRVRDWNTAHADCKFCSTGSTT